MPAKGQKVKQSVKDFLSKRYKGEGNPNWQGGRSIHFPKIREAWNKGTKGLTKANKTSFVKGQRPKNYNGGLSFNGGRWHVICRNDRSLLFSRVVIGCYLKRDLLSSEIIHHIDGDPTNDNIENLMIVTRSEHINIHRNQLLEARGIKLSTANGGL